MAKRSKKTKDGSSDWLSSVVKNPISFESWQQYSRHLPIQPRKNKAMSAYANRRFGIFCVGFAIIFLIVLLFALLKGWQNVDIEHTILLIILSGCIEMGMLWLGIEHIRHSSNQQE